MIARSTVGLRSSPIRLRSSPIGLRSFPIQLRSSRTLWRVGAQAQPAVARGWARK